MIKNLVILISLSIAVLVQAANDKWQSDVDYLFCEYLNVINENSEVDCFGGPFKLSDFNVKTTFMTNSDNDISGRVVRYVKAFESALVPDEIIFDIYNDCDDNLKYPFTGYLADAPELEKIFYQQYDKGKIKTKGRITRDDLNIIANNAPFILYDDYGEAPYQIRILENGSIDKQIYTANNIYAINKISEDEIQILYYLNPGQTSLHMYYGPYADCEMIIYENNDQYYCFMSQYKRRNISQNKLHPADFILYNCSNFEKESIVNVLELANQYKDVKYINSIYRDCDINESKSSNAIYYINYINHFKKTPLLSATLKNKQTGWEVTRLIPLSDDMDKDGNNGYMESILDATNNTYSGESVAKDLITNNQSSEILKNKIPGNDYSCIIKLLAKLSNFFEFNTIGVIYDKNKVEIEIDNKLCPKVIMAKRNDSWYFTNLKQLLIPIAEINYKDDIFKLLDKRPWDDRENYHTIVDNNSNNTLIIRQYTVNEGIVLDLSFAGKTQKSISLKNINKAIDDLKDTNEKIGKKILIIYFGDVEHISKEFNGYDVNFDEIWLEDAYGLKRLSLSKTNLRQN